MCLQKARLYVLASNTQGTEKPGGVDKQLSLTYFLKCHCVKLPHEAALVLTLTPGPGSYLPSEVH